MSPTIKAWLEAAITRAIRTMAQTAVATIASAVVMSEVDWLAVGSASLLAGIVSLLMSLSGLPEVAGGESVRTMVAKLEPDDQ